MLPQIFAQQLLCNGGWIFLLEKLQKLNKAEKKSRLASLFNREQNHDSLTRIKTQRQKHKQHFSNTKN